MKKLAALLLSGSAFCTMANAQAYFEDNFESYTVNSYLAPQSNTWTVWSGSEGGSDDVYVANNDAHSGTKSVYIESSSGGGPQDLLLDLGGLHNSGTFKYSMWMKVPTNKNAYFNFQGGVTWGSIWSAEFYWYGSGNFSTNGLSSTFPLDQWFKFEVFFDFDNDTWDIYIDGALKGTINNTNGVSYVDYFPADPDSEFWFDDVFYCANYACNPELGLSNLNISPSTNCTHHTADVSLTVTNNSSFTATTLELGLEVGSILSTTSVNINLAGNSSTTINVPDFFKSSVSGGSVSVKAINMAGDLVSANDETTTTTNVLPSPSNAKIIHGANWQSTNPNSAGIVMDPDIVTDGHTLNYEIEPPTGFANSGYGSTWDISNLNFYTSGGVAIAASYYSLNGATGSSNATISFSPDNSLLDSTVMFCFSVNSLVNSCDSVLCRYVKVVPSPVADWSAADVCDKDMVSFVNSSTLLSGLMTYSWDFGDGNTSSLASPTHTYQTYGQYDVKLVVTSDFGYKDSLTKTVNVFQLPETDFTVQNACEGTALSFADASLLPVGTPTYSWDFGDGSAVSNAQNPTHLYATPGLYTVTLTVTINGCPDSKQHYATQADRAVPDFTASTSCNNMNAVFSNGTTIDDGTFGSMWKFGDGNSITAYSPKHKYSGFGSFDVTLIVTSDKGCVDSITKTISLDESPKADFSMSSLCSGEEAVFNNLTTQPGGGANSYEWDLGNNQTSTDDNPSTVYQAPGTFDIVLIAANTNGCTDTLRRSVTIDTKPIADFIATDICEGGVSDFLNNSINVPAGSSYSWDFDNGVTSKKQDTSFKYADPGAYEVKLYVSTPNGCLDTATKMVMVFEKPDATFLFASAQKGDGSFTFSANAGTGNSYQWFMGDGTPYTIKDFTHKFNYSGTFEVKLVVTSADGCVSEHKELVSVFPSGIAGGDAGMITAYPNPTSGSLTLDLSALDEGASDIRVIDAMGKVVMESVANTNTAVLDLKGLSAGTYLIQVNTASGTYTTRVQLLP